MQPMQSMKFASRKRFRSDSTYVRPQKATRVSRKSFYRLAKSSPDTKGHLTALIAAAPIPGTPSVYHQPSDEETGFDLPLHNSQNVSSMIGPSPPRTPPQQKESRLRSISHSQLCHIFTYQDLASHNSAGPRRKCTYRLNIHHGLFKMKSFIVTSSRIVRNVLFDIEGGEFQRRRFWWFCTLCSKLQN